MNKLERFRRVHSVWSWLPAFRAAAETESLREASAILEVSRPAVSRTIKLVEQELGIEIFDRSGRSLELTDQGIVLLDGVRDAMRRIDDQLDIMFGAAPTSLTLALTPSVSWCAQSVYQLVESAETPLKLNVENSPSDSSRIRKGDFDACIDFEERVEDDRALEVLNLEALAWQLRAPERITPIRSLADLKTVRVAALSDVAQLRLGPVPMQDVQILATVASPDQLERLCRKLGCVAAFPAAYPIPDDFVDLDIACRPTPMVALRRRRLQDRDEVDMLLDAARDDLP